MSETKPQTVAEELAACILFKSGGARGDEDAERATDAANLVLDQSRPAIVAAINAAIEHCAARVEAWYLKPGDALDIARSIRALKSS